MTEPTNYRVSSGADLNTIFSSIAVNQIDYGLLPNNFFVGEVWTSITPISQVNTTPNNITIIGNNGFKINSSGLYRLNISLNFGNCNEQTQRVVFILSSSPNPIVGDVYDFTPSPTMQEIYAINCSGANNINNGNAANNLNNLNLGNCFTLNTDNFGIDRSPYFFSFQLDKEQSDTSLARSNFFTLDITFQAQTNKFIYPYIRIRDEQSGSASVTLTNSKWMFTKINNM